MAIVERPAWPSSSRMRDVTQESGQTVNVLVVGAGVAGLTTSAELQRAGCLELVFDGKSVIHRAVGIAR